MEWKNQIVDILQSDYEPTDWEWEFLDSIATLYSTGKTITEKQEAVLNSIYEKSLKS